MLNLPLQLLEDLKLVESRMDLKLTSEVKLLSEIGGYLLGLGGKKIRPILTLIAARAVNPNELSKKVIDAAAGIELIHTATLIHDDIIDNSSHRRSQLSAPAKFGIGPALIAGDFLWVRAFGLCANLGEFVVSETENACVELTEGEILEKLISEEYFPTLEDVEEIAIKKTASLFSLSTTVGSFLNGGESETIISFKRYGKELGIIFQMIDDILDLLGDVELLGKPAGNDLRQKSPSLINVMWLTEDPINAKIFFSLERLKDKQLSLAIESIKKLGIANTALIQAKKRLQTAEDLLFNEVKMSEEYSAAFKYLGHKVMERCNRLI